MYKNNFFIEVKTPARFDIDFVKKNMIDKICTINTKDKEHAFRELVTGDSVYTAGGVCSKVADDGSYIIITNMCNNDGWEAHDIRCYAEYLSENDIMCMNTADFTSTPTKYTEYMKNGNIKAFNVENINRLSKNIDILCNDFTINVFIDNVTEDQLSIKIKKCDIRKFALCICKNVNSCIKGNDKNGFLVQVAPNDVKDNVKLRYNKDMLIVGNVDIYDTEIISAVKKETTDYTATKDIHTKKDEVCTDNERVSKLDTTILSKKLKDSTKSDNTNVKDLEEVENKNMLNINEIPTVNKNETKNEAMQFIISEESSVVFNDEIEKSLINHTCYIQLSNSEFYSGVVTKINKENLSLTFLGYSIANKFNEMFDIKLSDIITIQVLQITKLFGIDTKTYSYNDLVKTIKLKKFNTNVLKNNSVVTLSNGSSSVQITINQISNDTINFYINKASVALLKTFLVSDKNNIFKNEINSSDKFINIKLTVDDFLDDILFLEGVLNSNLAVLVNNSDSDLVYNTNNVSITENKTSETKIDKLTKVNDTYKLIISQPTRVFNLSDNILYSIVVIPLIDGHTVCGIVKEISSNDDYIVLSEYDKVTNDYIDYNCYASDIDENSNIQIIKNDAQTGFEMLTVLFKDISKEIIRPIFNTDNIVLNKQVILYDTKSTNSVLVNIINVTKDSITVKMSTNYITNFNLLCNKDVHINKPTTAYEIPSFIQATVTSFDLKDTVLVTTISNVKLDVIETNNELDYADESNVSLNVSNKPNLYTLMEALKLFLIGYEIRALSWDKDVYIWWDEDDLQIMDNQGHKRYDLAMFIHDSWEIVGYRRLN